MKRTYQPHKLRRKREHGFRKRMKTKAGRRVLKRRRQKGRHRLTAWWAREIRLDMKPNGLSKRMVIKSKKQVREILSQGTKRVGQFLTVYSRPKNKLREPKVAFLCHRDIRKATERNRLKRIIREVVRTNKLSLQKSENIFLLKDLSQDKTFWQIKEDFVRVISGTAQ